MSEGCSSHQKNKPKLTGTITEKLNNFHKTNRDDYINKSYNNVYPDGAKAAKNLQNFINSSKASGHYYESEVKFLEEWLLLHLDLIQQQNEEIVSKERTIFMLQQENEMLREHVNYLQGRIAYLPQDSIKECAYIDMTQNAVRVQDGNTMIYGCESKNINMNNCIKNYRNFSDILAYNSIVNRNKVQAPCDIGSKVATNINTDDKSTLRESHNSIMKRNKNDIVVVNNYQDTCQTSIKRKRLCSGSSAISNSTSNEEPHTSGKRRKSSTVIKDDKILMSKEEYFTQTGEISHDPERNEVSSASNLEVPRWRIRVYTSLYSMEGTENLDDDVYNRRHMRLENDERRRKRWDVQRIREQRVVEKLKLRQERISSGNNSSDKSKSVVSLWPSLEDVRFIEVSDELPVCAFGAPVPRLPPCEFSLPWPTNPVEPKQEPLKAEPIVPQVEQIPSRKNKPAKKPRKRRRASKR